MSTGENTLNVIVWAWTDRGDVPTRVLDMADLPEILPEILTEVTRMRCVGVVEVEIDGERVARGEDADEVLEQVEEHLAWNVTDEDAEELAPAA
jgi:hypothetical protein